MSLGLTPLPRKSSRNRVCGWIAHRLFSPFTVSSTHPISSQVSSILPQRGRKLQHLSVNPVSPISFICTHARCPPLHVVSSCELIRSVQPSLRPYVRSNHLPLLLLLHFSIMSLSLSRIMIDRTLLFHRKPTCPESSSKLSAHRRRIRYSSSTGQCMYASHQNSPLPSLSPFMSQSS